jgi:hypothetical protein
LEIFVFVGREKDSEWNRENKLILLYSPPDQLIFICINISDPDSMMSNDGLHFPNYTGALLATMNPLKIHPSLKNKRLIADYMIQNQELLKRSGVINENGETNPFIQVNICLEHGLGGLFPEDVI